MIDEHPVVDKESDDDLDLESHNKLLSAVSRLYKKQRVEAPKRSEPALNVSEFNLANNAEAGNVEKVGVLDLLKALDGKGAPRKIQDKFRSLESKAVKLPAPLEKIHSDKVSRSVGYKNLKSLVSRWNGVVEKNRLSEQLVFPLKTEPEVQVYRPMDFINTFKNPTELELNLSEALKKSEVAKQEEKIEEALFDMSLPEMIKHRRLMKKLRAQESYKILKIMKQNKIKSKSYRRLLRKEKAKQELKEFETLQKTNPEAALEKLQKLERDRAEERASLRHRNTGKWARGQAIRAKYNREARIELSQQLSKSRELTEKTKTADEGSSEEEEGDDNESGEENLSIGDKTSNPWLTTNQSRDVDGEGAASVNQFIEGYKKYWKNKNKEELTGGSGAGGDGTINNKLNKQAFDKLTDNLGNSNQLLDSTKIDEQEKEITNEENKLGSNDNKETQIGCEEKVSLGENGSSSSIDKTESSMIVSDKIDDSQIDDDNEIVMSKECKNVKTMKSNKGRKQLKRKLMKEGKKKNDDGEVESKMNYNLETKVGRWEVVANKKKEKRKKILKSDARNSSTGNEWIDKNIHEIFEKVDIEMGKKIKERLDNLERGLSEQNEDKLSKKRKKVTIVEPNKMDKTTTPGNRRSEAATLNDENEDEALFGGESEGVRDVIKTAESATGAPAAPQEDATRKEINPNQFMTVKPRVLNTQIPDVISGVEEAIDDDDCVETINDDGGGGGRTDGDNHQLKQRANLVEAFADDDVVEQFNKEKEAELKESSLKEIDLTLPGWGKWGGQGIKIKRRQVIKPPKVVRKDQNKPNVIINDTIPNQLKEIMVKDLPGPFKTVDDYEASIRAPIGATWVPQTAFEALTQPPVVRKMGAIIKPMTVDQINIDKKEKPDNKLKMNYFDSNRKTSIEKVKYC